MSPTAHIRGALTAAVAQRLAGNHARSAALVVLAAVPVLRGQVSWQTVQRIAAAWLVESIQPG